jgi:hypothetical protein
MSSAAYAFDGSRADEFARAGGGDILAQGEVTLAFVEGSSALRIDAIG